MEEVIYRHQDQTWHLSAHRAIFWKEEQALIVSDLHLGKSAHFRKAGIAVPANIGQDDLYRLQLLITAYNPSQIIIVGDMFHSRENNDVPYFKLWRQQFAHIRFKLVKGNHDILPAATYEALNVEVFDTLIIRDIHFIHEPCSEEDAAGYTFSGHLHPGIVVAGAGRQRLRLPCFYFGRHCSILPAFGRFTGLAMLEPAVDEAVFVIAENNVLKVN
ncbi:ligase-associated DNA damage response endonuclease PdeM [Chitinophaga filiformis]|uniref:Ligase-associated DNA damage response endonuclease PdeM n=1 Tax=Chitinophaga filiformis TaxID=104663 RepID=A0ABY4HZF2_CHIFI|nr:ligase-associated DNA damage response endonuclease PdeM [Chitinophaga filiformis]UPK69202.1 ligase-associated DNA damage response endonuclease PdeM [Chitinophaga filiformis]